MITEDPGSSVIMDPRCEGAAASPPLAELVDPAVRVWAVAVLDADEFLAQSLCHRARSAVTDDPFGVGPFDLAHRSDHRGGPAGEHLGQFPAPPHPTPPTRRTTTTKGV